MRIVLGLLIVALLVGVATPAQAQANIVMDFSNTSSTTTVDLVQHAGQKIRFQISSAQFGNNPSAAFVTLSCSAGTGVGKCPVAESIVVGLADPTASGNWVGELNVNERNLIKGNWSVVATGQSSSSTSLVPSSSTYHLNVTAPSVAKPVLRPLNLDPTVGYAKVAKNQNVGISIESSLIRSVKFQIDGGAMLDWGTGPYSLAASNFVPTGLHTLKVVAEDRTGQSANVTMKVYADTNDPNVAHNIPARMFLGVPNKVMLNVTDDSNVTVSARMGSQVSTLTGTAGSRAYAPEITPTQLGSQLLEVQVQDLVGNRVSIVKAVDVVPLEVDIELVSVKQTDGGAILNEDMELTIEARQNAGILPIPVNVTYRGVDLGTFTVGVTGTTTHTINLRLAPGVYSGNLTLTVAPEVTELMLDNNAKNLTVEQFMARVIYRSDVYHIRAGNNGLPDVAVGLDGKTYGLTLKDRGLSTVYAFTVDGVELYWNPASLVTTVTDAANTATNTEDNGIPGAPPIALLGALLLLGLLRRRTA